VNEKNGVWGTGAEVPGIAALDSTGFSQVVSISCATAGNCAAGGFFYETTGFYVFLANEKNGVWGKAIRMPGAAGLGYTGGKISLDAVSCGAPGYCTAGGAALVGLQYHAFIVSEKKDVWGKARFVPGTDVLSVGGRAEVTSISCTSATACTAGGTYLDSSHNSDVFVASTDSMGVWQKAQILPGTAAALKVSGFATLSSLSCTSAGNCAAGGQFSDAHGSQAFVARRTSGVWGKATEVPGIAVLDNGATSSVTSVSCAGSGNCAAVGQDDIYPYVFVTGQTNGVWGDAAVVPGISNIGNSNRPAVISCAKAGPCGVGGASYDGSTTVNAFVTAP